MRVVAQRKPESPLYRAKKWKRYGVAEASESSTGLVWVLLRLNDDPAADVELFDAPLPGVAVCTTAYDQTPVSQAEAELVTGLYPPACWDRLREMA